MNDIPNDRGHWNKKKKLTHTVCHTHTILKYFFFSSIRSILIKATDGINSQLQAITLESILLPSISLFLQSDTLFL